MKPKAICKILIDVLMTLVLLFLMGYQFWQDAAHEWAGAGMFLLFLLHHVLNGNWYRTLLRGKRSHARVLQLVIDLLVFLAMLGLMASGVILSNHVFGFLHIRGGMGFARLLHMAASYWGFVLMALHLGLHWKMVLGMVRWVTGPVSSPVLRGTLRIGGAAVAVYGLYALVKNQIPSYLLLQSSFVFFDFERPLPLFFTEYPSWGCLFFWPTTVRGECSG